MSRSYHKITDLINTEIEKLGEMSDVDIIESYIKRVCSPRSLAFHSLIFERALKATMKKRDLKMVKADNYQVEIDENLQFSIA